MSFATVISVTKRQNSCQIIRYSSHNNLQSEAGDKWLNSGCSSEQNARKEFKKLAVVPAFVSDCLETKNKAITKPMKELAECLNDGDEWCATVK
jgi:protoheme ferro-lyase